MKYLTILLLLIHNLVFSQNEFYFVSKIYNPEYINGTSNSQVLRVINTFLDKKIKGKPYRVFDLDSLDEIKDNLLNANTFYGKEESKIIISNIDSLKMYIKKNTYSIGYSTIYDSKFSKIKTLFYLYNPSEVNPKGVDQIIIVFEEKDFKEKFNEYFKNIVKSNKYKLSICKSKKPDDYCDKCIYNNNINVLTLKEKSKFKKYFN